MERPRPYAFQCSYERVRSEARQRHPWMSPLQVNHQVAHLVRQPCRQLGGEPLLANAHACTSCALGKNQSSTAS